MNSNAPKMAEIEIKLPSDPKYLKIIRSSIAHIGEMCSLTEEEGNQVTLAVDEAVANIIKHTYHGVTDKIIYVTFRIDSERLEVVLRDFGKKVDPDKIKPRALDDIRPGGLGVHLIKSTMDEVLYDNSSKVGNKLTLAKYLARGKEEKNA